MLRLSKCPSTPSHIILFSSGHQSSLGSRFGAAVRALAFHQCICPGFDSRTWCHMWAEFVGSLLCSKRFFFGYSSFAVSPKSNIWFDLIWFELMWFAIRWLDTSWYQLIGIIIRTPDRAQRNQFDFKIQQWKVILQGECHWKRVRTAKMVESGGYYSFFHSRCQFTNKS